MWWLTTTLSQQKNCKSYQHDSPLFEKKIRLVWFWWHINFWELVNTKAILEKWWRYDFINIWGLGSSYLSQEYFSASERNSATGVRTRLLLCCSSAHQPLCAQKIGWKINIFISLSISLFKSNNKQCLNQNIQFISPHFGKNSFLFPTGYF